MRVVPFQISGGRGRGRGVNLKVIENPVRRGLNGNSGFVGRVKLLKSDIYYAKSYFRAMVFDSVHY